MFCVFVYHHRIFISRFGIVNIVFIFIFSTFFHELNFMEIVRLSQSSVNIATLILVDITIIILLFIIIILLLLYYYI